MCPSINILMRIYLPCNWFRLNLKELGSCLIIYWWLKQVQPAVWYCSSIQYITSPLKMMKHIKILILNNVTRINIKSIHWYLIYSKITFPSLKLFLHSVTWLWFWTRFIQITLSVTSLIQVIAVYMYPSKIVECMYYVPRKIRSATHRSTNKSLPRSVGAWTFNLDGVGEARSS